MLLFTVGLVLTNLPIHALAAIIDLLTVVLPCHPFAYLYNYSVRHWFDRPKLPPRSHQAKFAGGVAAIWLIVIKCLFSVSLFVWGYVLGGFLFVVALLVSTVDFCIPSLIYKTLLGRDHKRVSDHQ